MRLIAGGKRLRAGFLYWGYRASGRPDSDALVRLAAAMEFFQAAALLHDDVMDGSDTRRGMPAAHRAFRALHADSGWAGDSDRFGESAAILAGDLCLQWSDELYATSGLRAPTWTADGGPSTRCARSSWVASTSTCWSRRAGGTASTPRAGSTAPAT